MNQPLSSPALSSSTPPHHSPLHSPSLGTYSPRAGSRRQDDVLSVSPMPKPSTAVSSSTEASAALIQQLKEAVLASQRQSASPALVQNAPVPTVTYGKPTRGRIPSIKDDDSRGSPRLVPSSRSSDAQSPSLAASFDSPLLSTSTDSTESVGSVRTVRGSAMPTPAATSGMVFTPSYPFPRVPGTPHREAAQRRAFQGQTVRLTRLSSIGTASEPATPKMGSSAIISGPETGNMPKHAGQVSEEDNGPNLYELVLILNSDPGLHSWWSSVVKIFTEFYGADRMSLALPADAGEVENVPWGQKASYNKTGPPLETSALISKEPTTKPPPGLLSASNLARPQLSSRHSYAAPAEAPLGSLKRPGGLSRMHTFAYASRLPPEASKASPVPIPRMFSASDSEFSVQQSIASDGPYSQVLSVLRALNFESDALLEAGSVNKIIERASTVVLTRDYSAEKPSSSDHTDSQKTPKLDERGESSEKTTLRKKVVSGGESTLPTLLGSYEEYEQAISSPWAQSPAPSPAIQSDPEMNPFFARANVDDDAFNPRVETPDYSDQNEVEAIGVDIANTVMHIPLVHPRASSKFNQLKNDAASIFGLETSGRMSPQKKIPIAILSFSAPVVPYPNAMIRSLQLLMPHLATSFDLAQQYTNIYAQSDAHYKNAKGQAAGGRRITLVDLNETDIDVSTDSFTSPSDYSGRSRQSPGGSSGTPSWDTGNFGLSSANIIPGTPGVNSASEMIESYFEARKTRSDKAISELQQQPSSASSSESFVDRETDLSRIQTKKFLAETPGKPRTYLHSYGADFSTTFQTLPATATPLHPPKLPENATGFTQPSVEIAEMPPPSERLLRTITDSLPVQIFTAAPRTGAITWVNSRFLVYRGQEAEDILRNPWKAVHPDDMKSYLEEWKRSLHNGQPFSSKVRLQRFDGEYRFFYVRATPLKDKRQRIVHWTGTCMDVHEQHIAEVNASRQKETEASEAKYRAVANSSPQIVFAVEPSLGLVFCNSQWLRYSGQTEEDATGLGFLDYIHPEDLDRCRLPGMFDELEMTDDKAEAARLSSGESSESEFTVMNQALSPGTRGARDRMTELVDQGIVKELKDQDGRSSYSTEVRLRSKDGEYHWHLVKVLLSESNGEATWYGTCTDIHDHKLLEQQLKQTMETKSRFLSNMSHEIRTPLNGILGMVNFLMDTQLNLEASQYVSIIRNSTENLRDLINDILLFSKVEANMLVLNHNWMDVRKLMEETNDLMYALAFDKGLELNYLLDPRVPLLIKGDQFRIRQILINLVGNAIKFTEFGEVFVACTVDESAIGLDESERMIKFEVRDTGKGFTQEEAATLFVRFSQLGDGKFSGGTGLGLAISMALVELHGGNMDARGDPGRGAVFTFTIRCGIPTEKDGTVVLLDEAEESEVKLRPTYTTASSSVGSVPSLVHQTSAPDTRPSVTQRSSQSSVSISSPGSGMHLSNVPSSGSSVSSIHRGGTPATSQQSIRSSVSSEFHLPAPKVTPLQLQLPELIRDRKMASSDDSVQTLRSPTGPVSSTFAILVICNLPNTQHAIVNHLERATPHNSTSNITSRSSVEECKDLLTGPQAVNFSHIIIDVKDVPQILSLLDTILKSGPRYTGSTPSIFIITDMKELKELTEQGGHKFDFDALRASRSVQTIAKPLKTSKFSPIFDSKAEGKAVTDTQAIQAQAVAQVQRNAFNSLSDRFGDKGLKVLLLEDNRVNQQVLIRYLNRIHVDCDVVENGQQGLDRFHAMGPGYYILILCDLEMPVKDGYDTCKEIRIWEHESKVPNTPIVALSANVLGDVYAKCVDAGFSSYVTKPVDFQELGNVLHKFLDGENPARHEFLKMP